MTVPSPRSDRAGLGRPTRFRSFPDIRLCHSLEPLSFGVAVSRGMNIADVLAQAFVVTLVRLNLGKKGLVVSTEVGAGKAASAADRLR